jgi:hypothetical protein
MSLLDCKKKVLTSTKASLGQVRNQSIVVQLTREGYFLKYSSNCYPAGLMNSTMCKFLLHLLSKMVMGSSFCFFLNC